MKQSGKIHGVLWMLFFVVGLVVAVWYMVKNQIGFPPVASEHGKLTDTLFMTTFVVTAVVFLITQFLLVFFAYRYRGEKRAYWYPENRKLEIIWTIVPAIILTVLIVYGQIGWAKLFSEPPEDAFVVEITAEQFAWNVRYPGPDGEFGRTDPHLITMANPIGLDLDDPAAQDDIVFLNEIRLPYNEPVLFLIRSKDVLHSVYLPNFRVKMDAVPGMTTSFWFVPTKTGEFELACAELCGLGHYRMRGYVEVIPREELDEWLAAQ